MSVALFTNVLANLPAERVRSLDASLAAEGLGGIEAVYVSVWPEPTEELEHRRANRAAFGQWRAATGVPTWAWIVCSKDQAADATKIVELHEQLRPSGWKLNIEAPLNHAKLGVLLKGALATTVPLSASLAGQTASHMNYDYRALERAGVEIDWQAYFDSGEGQPPALSVAELYQSSFVIPGWEYRHRLDVYYGWGKVGMVSGGEAWLDSYRRPGTSDGRFTVAPREWGWWVVDHALRRNGQVGTLMGRAAYARIRITLDVTRTAQARPPAHWTPIAASARVAGASKRPLSVYLAENTSDEVIVAIARGAA